MRYAWDEEKNRRNRAKHGVSFETAQLVFEDPFSLSVNDEGVAGEQRWHTLGSIGGIVVLLVVHTSEEDTGTIRIISARKATPQERRRYEETD